MDNIKSGNWVEWLLGINSNLRKRNAEEKLEIHSPKANSPTSKAAKGSKLLSPKRKRFILGTVPGGSPKETFGQSMLKETMITIENHFQQNKPYLKSSYMILDLSPELGISREVLQLAIKSNLDMSFLEYIRHHRILEAKRLLDENKIPIESLDTVGLMCGYTKQSKFLKEFCKSTGMEYLEYINSSQELTKG